MKVRYLAVALRDLNIIQQGVARDSPAAARRVVEQIRSFIDLLQDVPDAGRALGELGLRTSPVPRLPYVIYDRRLALEVRILRIRHGHRRPLNWT